MLKSIITFYRQGFANMTLGKTLWKIIIIKLLVIFIVLKFFIYGESIADLGEGRSAFVLQNLTDFSSSAESKLDCVDCAALESHISQQRSSNGSY